MVQAIDVRRVSRDDEPRDLPASFGKLHDLHLDLIENKKKLKKGLPLIPLRPIKIKHRESFKAINHLSDMSKERDKKREEREERRRKRKERRHGGKEEMKPLRDDDAGNFNKERHDGSDSDSELVQSLGAKTKKNATKKRRKEKEVLVIGEEDSDVEALRYEEEGESEEEEDGEEGESEEEEEEEEEESEESQKEEYLWRFRILKKAHRNPSVPIPEFNEHSDLEMMKTSYQRTLRELHLDETVDTYRNYLIGSCIVMEFVATRWIGFNITGFARSQAMAMHKYDRLLFELGEKSYGKGGSNLPVEVRLIGMVLMQAGLFYLGKIISDKIGANVGDLFKGMTGQPSQPSSKESGSHGARTAPRKMRGPSLRASEIRPPPPPSSSSSHSHSPEDM